MGRSQSLEEGMVIEGEASSIGGEDLPCESSSVSEELPARFQGPLKVSFDGEDGSSKRGDEGTWKSMSTSVVDEGGSKVTLPTDDSGSSTKLLEATKVANEDFGGAIGLTPAGRRLASGVGVAMFSLSLNL